MLRWYSAVWLEMQQMVENARLSARKKPLTYGEREKLLELAEGMKIPFRARPAAIAAVTARCSWTFLALLSVYNELVLHLRGDHCVIRLDGLSEEKRSSACTPAESVRRSVLRTSTFRRLCEV